MNGEIDRKVLHAAMLRIEDDDDKLYACRNCVFRNVISMLVCPNEIKEDVLELR